MAATFFGRAVNYALNGRERPVRMGRYRMVGTRGRRVTRARRPVAPRIIFKQKMPSMLNSPGEEIKAVDTTINQGFLTTVQVTLLNTIAEGSSFYQRVGRKTHLKYISLKGWIRPSNLNAAAITRSTIRYVIVYDRSPQGAVPSYADIFQDTSAGGANSSSVNSGPNMDNKFRFAILRDRIHEAPPLGVNGAVPAVPQPFLSVDVTGDSKYSFNCTEFIRTNATTQYSGPNGTIGDVRVGAIYLVTFSDTDANANAAWVVDARCRIRYTD